MAGTFLQAAIQQFKHYKSLTEGAVQQLSDDQLYWKPNEASNSIAAIMKHMAGNMLSRFTDFLTADGEKPWRDREGEFNDSGLTRQSLMHEWNKAWDTLFSTLQALTPADLEKTVYIRTEPFTVTGAVIRQLAHYPYHVGQVVYAAKAQLGDSWQSLSIPKGGTADFNAHMFAPEGEKIKLNKQQ